MSTITHSAARGVASLLREIRDERARGDVGTACMLFGCFLTMALCVAALVAMAVLGMLTLILAGEWLTIGLMAAAVAVVRFVWRLTEP